MALVRRAVQRAVRRDRQRRTLVELERAARKLPQLGTRTVVGDGVQGVLGSEDERAVDAQHRID